MRYIQPQNGVQLDKSNPLTRGLSFVLNSAYGIIDSVDFNTSTGDTTTGILSGVGQGGEYLKASDNTVNRRRNFTGITTTTAYTVASVVIDSTGRGFIRNPLDSDTASNPNRKFQLRFNASNFAEFIAFNTTPSAFTATGSVVSSGTDPSVLVGVVGEDKVARVYLNGVAGGTSTITGTVATLSAGNLGICGTLAAATQNFLGEIYLTAIWNRALTAGEVEDFSANWWQLFKGTRYIFPSAAAGNNAGIVIVDGADVSAQTVTVTTGATVSSIDAADVSATTVANWTTAGIAATDGNDLSSVSVTVTTAGTVAGVDGADVSSAIAANWTTAQVISTDAADITAVAATVTTGAALSASDTGDTAAIIANASGASVSATIAPVDGADVSAMAVTITTGAGLVIIDGTDTNAVQAAIWSTAQIAANDASDLSAHAAIVTTGAGVTVSDASDAANVFAANWTNALLAATDAGDINAATAGISLITWPSVFKRIVTADPRKYKAIADPRKYKAIADPRKYKAIA